MSPPDEPETWTLALAEFRSRLITDFPDAKLDSSQGRTPPDARHVNFHIHMTSCRLRGFFSLDPPELRLEGDLPDCAALAIWFRGQLPGEQELVFANDSYVAHVILTPASSARDVIQRFSA